ncbi:uncharacterized protein LOC126995209 [Eriocheir sinensis]|uniref:uncharacterized protein LOC126995209 n=1 Tax=Eriocheir sinensis TaxID=95602 RepID=UPI0021CAA786|nr:uncharacterized protein LOC126995209 [Eriocheir sinensis]
MSSLHFWSPTNGTSLTVTLISSTRNFTRHLTTIMPRHWHSIDIYQPREGSPVQLHIRPDLRYINMEHSRVGQIQASSEDLVHWFFCPNAYMCALPAAEEPAEGTTYAPGEREGLVAALVVVVLLLVASLVALAAVTFYRKAELFHIYAKPIDCLPKGPPPLPKANMQSTPRLDTRTDTKQAEAQNGAAVTGQEDNAKSNTADREVGQGSAAKSRPSSLTYPPVAYVPLKVDHESINSLYGLI